MGLFKMFGGRDDDERKSFSLCRHNEPQEKIIYRDRVVESKEDSNNPNPKVFVIEKTKQVGGCVVVKIHYPNCKNYEGRKILVFENIKEEKIYTLKFIDPHFCDGDHISPLARFEPTEIGWEYAITFCKSIKKLKK